MRIGTRSGKFRTVDWTWLRGNTARCVHQWQHDHFHRLPQCLSMSAHSLVLLHSVTSSRTLTVAQVLSLSPHPHGHIHVSVSPRLALPLYFLHYLPHSFPFLLHLKFVVYLNLLRTPHKEGMDSSDEFLFTTGYEPSAYDFKQTSVEPYTELLDLPPLFSEKVDYDDASPEDMLHQTHRAHAYHSLREDLSVSLSSSSMSDWTVRPVGDRTGRPVEQRNQEAQIRTLLDKQQEQILAECQARINKHEFQAAYDRRSLRRTSSRSSRRSSTTRSTASSRTINAAKFGITWSSSEKSHWNGRVKEVSEFYIRYYCKTKIGRGSEHYIGTFWPNTGIAKWNKLYEWFKGVSGCWINSQWKFPRYQSTSVIPTSSNSWRIAKPPRMVNMEWRLEFGLWTETILTPGLEFLMDQINLWWIRITTTEVPEDQLEEHALQLDAKDFACRSQAKAKPQRRKHADSSSGTIPMM